MSEGGCGRRDRGNSNKHKNLKSICTLSLLIHKYFQGRVREKERERLIVYFIDACGYKYN